jgi:hypothetical protein
MFDFIFKLFKKKEPTPVAEKTAEPASFKIPEPAKVEHPVTPPVPSQPVNVAPVELTVAQKVAALAEPKVETKPATSFIEFPKSAVVEEKKPTEKKTTEKKTTEKKVAEKKPTTKKSTAQRKPRTRKAKQ